MRKGRRTKGPDGKPVVHDKVFHPGALNNYFFLEDFFFAPFLLAATVYHPQSIVSVRGKS
jgi:hypothetical protein